MTNPQALVVDSALPGRVTRLYSILSVHDFLLGECVVHTTLELM